MSVKPLVIVGPTASGKTALSLDVARRLGGEIISMDSRQVYRGMDIGTAKVAAEQRLQVPHHGLDLVNPSERFGAGEFARRSRIWIQDIADRGKVPILVGGTGFFLRALTNPIFQEPELDPERRRRLQGFLEAMDTQQLHIWLAALDPPTAARLSSWGGRQRLIRGLELPLLTGRPLSWWHRSAPSEAPAVRPLVMMLDIPRDQLYRAINSRVEEMRDAGLVEEVRGLVESGYHGSDPGMNATGYAELLPYLKGDRSLEEALELIRKNTRAYARRQLTWFRHQLPENSHWLDVTRAREDLVEEVATLWEPASIER
ncbi:tRNA (adenosine(37)-N6)-dimethylallyltransferase MiaA [soil metagenome]